MMMKKRHNILSLLYCTLVSAFTFGAFTACSEDTKAIEETFGTTIFEVDPITFEGIVDGQTAEIQFVAGAPWTATFTSANNWVDVSPTHGQAGDAVIHVTPYSDNKSSSSRKAILMVLVDGYDQPFNVEITQRTAAESDLDISGDINDGVMTLNADDTGSRFSSTIQITSSHKWDIITDKSSEWLTFSKDQEPQDKETTVTMTVSGDYSKFTAQSMSGKFSLQVPGTSPVTILFEASAECKVFEADNKQENETERMEYELVDTLLSGTFQTLFYVESNVVWEIKDLPEWIVLATDKSSATNRKEDGTLEGRRVGVGLLVNEATLSAEKKSADLVITNLKGETLKTIRVKFNGIDNNYLKHDFAFPLYDPTGSDFSFEAKESYIDSDNRDDYWKKVELPFNITTSRDYSSIDDAPYHLVMCKGENGRIQKEEVHWASLRMGDATNSKDANGLFTKEIYLRANDRGDADDQDNITDVASIREAFIFIVPKDITFDDLFENGGTTLKDEYAESFSHIIQKQDHNASYVLELDGLSNGGTVYVPSEGGTYEFDVTNISTEQLSQELIRLFNNNGVWEEKSATTEQQQSVTIGYTRSETTGKVEKLILNVASGMVTEKRGFRFNISAFRGDGYSDVVIFTFDVMLKQ